jgi:uncharacterized protein (TIGR03435 family)
MSSRADHDARMRLSPLEIQCGSYNVARVRERWNLTAIRWRRAATVIWILCGGLGVVATMSAQSSLPASLEFDVASIKRTPDDAKLKVIAFSPGAPQPGGRWVASHATVYDMIRAAYPGHALPGQIAGGPPWASVDRFEVLAKTDPGRSRSDLEIMARALLATRFRLAVHEETRDLPSYALVHDRDDKRLGPGLKPPALDCDAYRAGRQRGEPIPKELIRYGDRLPCALARFEAVGYDRITAGGAPIAGIVQEVSGVVRRPVVDRTGENRPFDIELRYAPPRILDRPIADNQPPDIFTALREQLGLRLQSTTAQVPVMVIDRLEPPTPD